MKKITAAVSIGLSFLGIKSVFAQDMEKSNLLKSIQAAQKEMNHTLNGDVAELLKIKPEQLSDEEKNELIKGLLNLSEGLIIMDGNQDVLKVEYLNEMGASSFKGL